MKSLLVSLMLCVGCVAQTAKVIPLSTLDSLSIKSLQDQKSNIEKQIDTFNLYVQRTYLTTTKAGSCQTGWRANESKTDPSPFDQFTIQFSTGNGYLCSSSGCSYKESKLTPAEKKIQDSYVAWESRHPILYWQWCGGEFEYSEDYRFVVPKPVNHTNNTNNTIWYNNSGTTATPLTSVPLSDDLTVK